MLRLATFVVLLAPLATLSCSNTAGPKDLADAGAVAIGSGDFAAGLRAYESALEVIGDDSSHPQYFAAAFGCIEARTHEEPARVITDLGSLTAKLPGSLAATDYRALIRLLVDAKQFDHAEAVLALAQGAFPESEGIAGYVNVIRDARTQAEVKSDVPDVSETLKALEGLGYLGTAND